MTVLPNAPIDAATGLPVPTIAVATNGGVSVIKDDGTVVDGPTSGFDALSFNKDFNLAAVDYGGADDVILFLYPTWLSDGFVLDKQYYANTTPSTNYQFDNTVTDTADARFVATDSGLYEIGDYGLAGSTNVYSNPQDMIRYTTSDYNTGWMNGDIKLATLSDTDDTDVTGSELVDQTASGWGLPTGWAHDGSGTLSYDGTGAQYFKAYDTFTTVVGETYTFLLNVTAISGGFSIWANSGTSASGNWGRVDPTVSGKYSFTFTAQSTTTYITFQNNVATYTMSASDISVRLAEEDRSVNGNGLQVFGTVTKNPVATGADLVAYSGFSNNNYLQQPVNTDLQFGTGDFCAMGWFKTTNAVTEPFYFYGQYTTGWVGGGQHRVRLTSGLLDFGMTDDNWSSSDQTLSSATYSDGNWHHYCGVRRGGQIELYADGVLVDTTVITAATGSISNTGATLNYGRRQDGNSGAATIGSLALSRFSATAPSPEQIAKIYEDEKVLFQENAQATLYGDSDAVTALAYDDSTELLHVGTSAGRSVFQGLRRVDNTTTAVGAAISASNSMVAED